MNAKITITLEPTDKDCNESGCSGSGATFTDAVIDFLTQVRSHFDDCLAGNGDEILNGLYQMNKEGLKEWSWSDFSAPEDAFKLTMTEKEN